MKRNRVLGLYALVLALVLASFAIAQHEMQGMKHDMMDARSPAAKRAAATLAKEKAKTVAKGRYGCCLKHSCDFCALHMGHCTCGMMAAGDKPVCNECKGGWEAGDGAIEGKKPSEIKTMPRGMPGM